MRPKSWPSTVTNQRRIQVWRSYSALIHLDLEKKYSPEVRKMRSRQRPDSCPSASLPGPSSLSHTFRTALSSDGRNKTTKRKQEEQQDSPSKRPRSKNPSTDSSSSLGSEDMDSEGEETAKVYSRSYSTTNSDGSDEDMYQSYSGDSDVLEEVYTKYMVVEYICIGGFGEIYAGIRREDNFLVVLKYISKCTVTFTEMEVNGAMCSLPLEVSLLIRVGAGPDSSSSNITPLLLDWYDLGCEIVLVIERPEPCMDLVDYLRRQKNNVLETTMAQYFFRQLVEAAIEMEAKGVFHRDIKPENVLIETRGEENRARFIDFGCGTTFSPEQIFYEPQGTPLYGSPEWYRKKRYAACPVTVWQLGLVLYAMLFSRKSLISECTSGSRRRVFFPCAVSDECRDLLKGCLAMNPKKRLTLEKIRDHPWLNPA